jgi:hypothetical protein
VPTYVRIPPRKTNFGHKCVGGVLYYCDHTSECTRILQKGHKCNNVVVAAQIKEYGDHFHSKVSYECVPTLVRIPPGKTNFGDKCEGGVLYYYDHIRECTKNPAKGAQV